MLVSMSEIDLVELLNLDQSMSVGEIEIVLDNLSQEIYFRFLLEELPKLIEKADFDELHERYKLSDDLDGLMDEINDRFPNLHIEVRVKQISDKIKKEFILNYLQEMKKDYPNPPLHQDIDKLLVEVDREMIDKDLCWKIKEDMAKKINFINKK